MTAAESDTRRSSTPRLMPGLQMRLPLPDRLLLLRPFGIVTQGSANPSEPSRRSHSRRAALPRRGPLWESAIPDQRGPYPEPACRTQPVAPVPPLSLGDLSLLRIPRFAPARRRG